MAVDLHTHSSISDGSDTPTELVAKASQAGLTAVALTDHDTVEGLAEAAEAATVTDIKLIRGVELSVAWVRGGLHMVVLFLPEEGALLDKLAWLQTSRAARNERMVSRLVDLGYQVTLDEVRSEAGDGVIGRPHIAAVLVAKGYVADIPSAFDQLLAAGKPAYVGRDRLEPIEAIRLARQGRAVPIIAHPHTMGLDTADEYAAAFTELAEAGLIGLECHYGDYPPERRREFIEMADRFGLLPSGGSDYHGTYKAGLEIGVGRGDLVVPDHVLDDLEAAR